MSPLIDIALYAITACAVVRLMMHDDPTLLIIVLCSAMVLGLLTGCESVHQSRPVRGGVVELMADGSIRVQTPDNAKTPTPVAITRADGTQLNAELGTSSEPIITIKPGPKWSEWMVTAAGILCLIGGVVLAVKAWPRIGAALALCGLLLIGIGIMAGTHAWVIALGTAFIFLLVIGGLYYGYRTGTTQTAPAAA